MLINPCYRLGLFIAATLLLGATTSSASSDMDEIGNKGGIGGRHVTISPSSVSSSQPSLTQFPSSSPTLRPSFRPSLSITVTPSKVPSISPNQTPTCVNEPDWIFGEAAGCEQFKINPSTFCKLVGDTGWTYEGKSVYEACCSCGGGRHVMVSPLSVPSPQPSLTQFPSSSPTSKPSFRPSPLPALTPSKVPSISTSQTPTCVNEPQWMFGNAGCDQFSISPSIFCKLVGDTGWTYEGKSVYEACCSCGGGQHVTVSPLSVPLVPSISPGQVDTCMDEPGWMFGDAGGCELFNTNPSVFCKLVGDAGWKYRGKSAYEACCSCGGGQYSTKTAPSVGSNIVIIDFDDVPGMGSVGYDYYRTDIKMGNWKFLYGDSRPYTGYHYGTISEPNVGFTYGGYTTSTIRCPGGSFSLLSMWMTSARTDKLEVLIAGYTGETSVAKFSTIVSSTAPSYFNETQLFAFVNIDSLEVLSSFGATVVFDDIVLQISSPCTV